MSEFKGGFVPAELQRLQAPMRVKPTYGLYRWSHSEWPKRDADVDSNTLWEQEQVLLVLERIPRGTEVSPVRETREQPQARVLRLSHIGTD